VAHDVGHARARDQMLVQLLDWLRKGCVRSPVTYVDSSTNVKKKGADAGARPVIIDLTRPVAFGRL
jgi:malonyl CoA-acyl carrier protein transacylase